MVPAESATPLVSRRDAALAGLAAGGLALGVAELVAGLLPGAPSPIIAVGDLVIALQPPGAKQLVVDLFGLADKLILNLVVIAVALAAAAGIAIASRTRPVVATVGITAFGLLALGAGLRDPLAEPLITIVVALVASLVAWFALRWLLRLAARRMTPPVAEMPAWGRRRFIGTSIAVIGAAAVGGVLGRTLLAQAREGAVPQAGALPAPDATAPPPPTGASLDVAGITPLVTPNVRFYRIGSATMTSSPQLRL
jgi:hypothetical protein